MSRPQTTTLAGLKAREAILTPGFAGQPRLAEPGGGKGLNFAMGRVKTAVIQGRPCVWAKPRPRLASPQAARAAAWRSSINLLERVLARHAVRALDQQTHPFLPRTFAN